jgi:hypothetical protein
MYPQHRNGYPQSWDCIVRRDKSIEGSGLNSDANSMPLCHVGSEDCKQLVSLVLSNFRQRLSKLEALRTVARSHSQRSQHMSVEVEIRR